VVQPARKDI